MTPSPSTPDNTLPHPSCKTICIAGIDTDIGKSIVTGQVARYLYKNQQQVSTFKLVQTGCTGISEDILLHRRIMGQEPTELDKAGISCPYLFPFPASPALSARMTGQVIEQKQIDQALQTMQEQYDWLLVEGAGGLMVPLNERMTLLDYYAEKKFPTILVTSPRLGSINHTRLSLEALQKREIPVLGLVYNIYGENPGDIVSDTLAECRKALADYGYPNNIVILPDIKESQASNWQILLVGV